MDPESFTASLEPLALLAWFDPEHLETKLNDLTDEMPKPKLALTPTEKAERLASIKSELFEAEWLEALHIEAALNEGTIIAHRPNIDVRAPRHRRVEVEGERSVNAILRGFSPWAPECGLSLLLRRRGSILV